MGPSHTTGMALTASIRIEYARMDRRVWPSPATTGNIGTLAAEYCRLSSNASAQKCGGVQKKTIANSAQASGLSDPVTAAQPTSGGKAPAAPPMTMFWAVDRLSHIVYTKTYTRPPARARAAASRLLEASIRATPP